VNSNDTSEREKRKALFLHDQEPIEEGREGIKEERVGVEQ